MALNEAQQLAERLADVDQQLRSLWALWTFHANNGENRAMQAAASRFLELAPRSSTRADVLVGERLMGVMMHYRGRQDEARRYLERVSGLHVPPSGNRHLPRFQYDQQALAQASGKKRHAQHRADVPLIIMEGQIGHVFINGISAQAGKRAKENRRERDEQI